MPKILLKTQKYNNNCIQNLILFKKKITQNNAKSKQIAIIEKNCYLSLYYEKKLLTLHF